MTADIVPDGCRHCAPTNRQRLARMLARRRMCRHAGTDRLIADLKRMAFAEAAAKATQKTTD